MFHNISSYADDSQYKLTTKNNEIQLVISSHKSVLAVVIVIALFRIGISDFEPGVNYTYA